MSSIVNNAKNVPTTTAGRWLIAVIVLLLAVWTLGMMGVIHLPLALVWIIPFVCIVIGALAIMWEGGAFDE